MDKIKQTWQKVLEYIDWLKKHAFGDKVAKKRTFSTLEKLGICILISVACIAGSVYWYLDKYKDLNLMRDNMKKLATEIHGTIVGKSGLKESLTLKKDYLEEQETTFETNQKNLLEKLNTALLKDFDYYEVAAFLEDYTITMSTKDKPIILSSISPGTMETVSVAPDKLKVSMLKNVEDTESVDEPPKDEVQADTKKEVTDPNINKITTPAEFKVVPLNIVLEAHPDKFEDFLRFVYHSGDIVNYYYKGKPVPVMAVASLNLPMEKVSKIGEDTGNKSNEPETESYSIKLNLYLQKEQKTK